MKGTLACRERDTFGDPPDKRETEEANESCCWADTGKSWLGTAEPNS